MQLQLVFIVDGEKANYSTVSKEHTLQYLKYSYRKKEKKQVIIIRNSVSYEL